MTTDRYLALRRLTGLMRLDDGRESVPAMPESAEDWSGILALANEHLLGPNLFDAVQRADCPAKVPPEVVDYLMMLKRRNRRRNADLRNQAEEIIEAFNRRSITPLILKGGVSLFENPHPLQSKAGRMMRDLDFLVPRRDLTASVLTLRELGYDILSKYPNGHHAYAEFGQPGLPGAIDLHTELIDPRYILPAKAVFKRAVPAPRSRGMLLLPEPTDRLLHHILHAQVHYLADFYRGRLNLNQVYEFAVWSVVLGERADWDRIERTMARHHLTTALQSYCLAGHHLFGMPWPCENRRKGGAVFHCGRCLVQLRYPWLEQLFLPIANVRRAFAWHRMRAFYGMGNGLIVAQIRHAWRVLRKMTMRQVVARVLRTE